MTDRALDPIPAPIAQLLGLFDGPLQEVRFPGIDREVLHAHADDVRAKAAALEEARAALERARAALDEGHKELHKTAEQALAYAKVFATGDEALSAELEALSLAPDKRGDKRGDKKTRERRRAAEPRAEKKAPQPAPKKTGLELPLVKQEGEQEQEGALDQAA